ncbi:hypothetical protein CC80DRAFT_432298 [Byssothecium circinans]|uniref:Uncharacterized protein n=1 Tax=Byssothecium circinans TaxID=147558 RepID=A0A6A5T7G0_9PLEO|nr:hypothetical protein CC80DRAFT_432305 [Byssothecium circinans]KAF1948130.1 hypothetical protein CC80DRAFT_432298 [Byssothecium circinans]
MVAVNVHARGHLKKQLLTFGDVIVASASNLELRVQGECMVNANESYRRRNTHVCHKHCKSKEDSKTGDEIGHCQKCNKYNSTNKFHNQPQPTIATKIKRSFISNLGTTALVQMCIMMFVSFVLLSASLIIAVPLGANAQEESHDCARLSAGYDRNPVSMPSNTRCMMTGTQRFEEDTGGWGGFNRSVPIAKLPPNQLTNELVSFCISNGAQFIYSLLYILLIYNLTLVSQEYHWGKLEHKRKRLRCTIVKGESFEQDYLLQLPKKILFPVMVYSIVTHWVLGEALQTQEAIWMDKSADRHVEHSMYIISFAAYPLWCATVMILTMTSVCWWAFTYRREGFIPQMFGSIRVLCAATSQLDDFPSTGVQWGDLGMGKRFRHAGISAEDVQKIVPYEVYAGTGEMSQGKRKKQFGRGRRAISEAGQNKGLSGN